MIARYIEHGGFLDVTIVGGTGDLGADIVGSFNGKRWVLQAKFRTSVNIGKAAVIEAFTAHWCYDADIIVAATNKKFTDDALQYRDQRVREGFQVYLWDQSFFLAQFDNLSEYSEARREPRTYQRTAINALHTAGLNGKNKALITLATGLGKTIVASTFVAEFLENNPDSKVLFLAHMTDLVKQLERASWSQFSKFTDTHVWTDGEIPVYVDGVTFATWQSVVSAYRNGISLERQYDLVVVDECHHAPSESFNDLLNYLEPKFLVGVTATPWRGDGESLRPLFGDPVFSMDVVEGMQQGFLAEVDYLMLIDGIDWDEIRELSREGLSVKDLNQRLYVPERDIGMIETICQTIEATINPRTLVFCRSIAHAERIQKFFRQFDISAGVLQ